MMKFKILLIFSLSLVFILPFARADTNITGCYNFTTSGTYNLQNNIVHNGNATCMNITTNNVTLNCNGYYIDGISGISESNGILTNTKASNTTIKNCNVTNWGNDIKLSYNSYDSIVNNTISLAYNSGVNIESSNFSSFLNNSVYGQYTNFVISSSSNNTFSNNVIYGNTYCFRLDGTSSNNTFFNNTIYSCTVGFQFYTGTESYNNITKNNIHDNTYGIYFQLGDKNDYIYNNILNNTANVVFETTTPLNYFNVTNQTGTRIYSSGTNIGGNYWTNSTGNGYSDTCIDANRDGFCDFPLNMTNMVSCSGITCFANATDYLPLSNEYAEYTTSLLWLNGTGANYAINYNSTVNITAKSNTTGLIIQIYFDGTLIANGTNTISNTTTIWPGGNHTILAYTPGNVSYAPSSQSYILTVTPIGTIISQTSSSGWNIIEGTETTISCLSSNTSDLSITKNGVVVSNPYTFIPTFGDYVFNCSVPTQNFTSTPAINILSVILAGSACINTSTYIYTATIPLSASQVTLDFTTLYNQYMVNWNLTDVYVTTPNTTTKFWANSTVKYLLVNSTNVSSFTIQFGNAFALNTYTNATPINATITNFTYSQIASYFYTINILNEINGTAFSNGIPSANTTMNLWCSITGEDARIAPNGTFSFPTTSQLLNARIVATYSPTSVYYRDLPVTSPAQTLNFYMIDAVSYQVVQMLLTLEDNSGIFTSAHLRITKQLGGSNVVITDLPFDIESKGIVYLQNGGIYTVYIYQGSTIRGIGNLFVDNVNLIKNIIINPTITIPNMDWNISRSLSINNVTGTITFVWHDPSNNTNQLNMSIYNQTDGTLLEFFTSTNSSDITFSYAGVPTGVYKVTVSVDHNLLSNHPYIMTWILSALSTLVPFIDTLIFPSFPPTFLMWGGFVIITSFAMIFDQRNGALAGVIVSIVAIALIAVGWWPVSNKLGAGITIGVVALFLAVINMLGSKRRVDSE